MEGSGHVMVLDNGGLVSGHVMVVGDILVHSPLIEEDSSSSLDTFFIEVR